MTGKNIPFDFVLDCLTPLEVTLKPMFGLHAVYINTNRIILMLRDKKDRPEMNGVWVATTEEHHAGLKEEFPSLTSISAYADESMRTGWQVLPAAAPGFESAVMSICELIKQGDPRIGKTVKRPNIL